MATAIISNAVLVAEIDRLVNDGMQVTFTPKGNSMLPFIRGERDTVMLKAPENIRKGDIVLAATSASTYVLHRVIDINGDQLILMGDGNLVGTEKCRMTDVIAVAVKINKGRREIDCNSRSHQRRADIWRILKPVRRYLLAIYRRIIL